MAEFDHHCKWLNTCIGKKNYSFLLFRPLIVRYFFSLLVVLSVYAFLMLVVLLALLILSFSDEEVVWPFRIFITFLIIVVSDVPGLSSLIVYRCLLLVFLLVSCALLYYALELLIFHIRLYAEGATTYCSSFFFPLDTRISKTSRKSPGSPACYTSSPSNTLCFYSYLYSGGSCQVYCYFRDHRILLLLESPHSYLTHGGRGHFKSTAFQRE